MDRIVYLVGDSSIVENADFDFHNRVLCPYSEIVCSFLDDLSKAVMSSPEAKKYTDVISLGFWCRKSNILKMKEKNSPDGYRLGRGLAFHIAPSNVPTNTFYTLIWGLLAGCYNIVKAPSRYFGQIELVCGLICRLVEERYKELKPFINIVRYARDSGWTEYFSMKCMVRMIWGGDDTIRQVSAYAMQPRAKELRFSDRYSLALLSLGKLREITPLELKKLARSFYNDTYLMDQNACSSPHLICFLNDCGEKDCQEVKARFWEALYLETLRYDLEEIKSMEKFTISCELEMQYQEIESVKRYGNRLYVLSLNDVPDDIEKIRGRYGLFLEYEAESFVRILEKLSPKTQTCLYYGINPKEVAETIVSSGSSAVDRIVPVGEALSIKAVWDGYDVVGELSRRIDCG